MITEQIQKLTKKDLINFFIQGGKQEQQIGIEFEKIGVTYSDNLAVPYKYIENLLEHLSEFEDYKRIVDNSNLIGLKNKNGHISLEPGSQFELSLYPKKDLASLGKQIKDHNALTHQIAQNLGIKWLGTGLQPISTYSNINIIPKQRYKIMSEYLPTVAKTPLVMMRETAGIQVGIDYNSQEDAIEKLRLSLKLAPIVSAVFANSPIRNGKLSGYKSYRAYSWLSVDNERCGLISKKLFDKNYHFTFEDYINILCDTQMIMINNNNACVPVSNFTFNDFIKNGFQGRYPDMSDFEQHLSLYFTDTRLKTYLEIRNHDSQKSDLIMCPSAFWKGIMYNKDARNEIDKILSNLTYDDFEDLRHQTPKYGLDLKNEKINLKEISKEIFNIAYICLKQDDEQHFLEPILELVNDGITPADIVIRNFEGLWKQDIKKYIEFSQI